MVCQFEETIDVLKGMHPNYKFVHLFYYSSGHSKHIPNGLSSIRMGKPLVEKGSPCNLQSLNKKQDSLASVELGTSSHRII